MSSLSLLLRASRLLDPPHPQPARGSQARLARSVGFDSITQQIEHKLLKRGFQVRPSVASSSLPTTS